MALSRCENCGKPKGRNGNNYTDPARLPVGHPQSGVVCGTQGCTHSGLVWLLDLEQKQYMEGIRVFDLTGKYNHTKLAVQ
jgi:hypothetical protein